eukprot:g63896.t1
MSAVFCRPVTSAVLCGPLTSAVFCGPVTSAVLCGPVMSTVLCGPVTSAVLWTCDVGFLAVAAWTLKAMTGNVPFHVALAERLALFHPSKKDIATCLAKHPLQLTPGVKELIDTLHSRNTHVYLVSGGFRQMIAPLAPQLNIPTDRIFANKLLFKADGSYAGFDEQEPTSRAGGKAKVVEMLKKKHGYATMFMVGDGATDMEARPPADAFIGFGGIAIREVVQKGADWFVTDMQELIAPLRRTKL